MLLLNNVSLVIWLVIMHVIQRRFIRPERIPPSGRTVFRVYYLFAFVVVLPLILMAALRSNSFGDTALYRTNYLSLPSNLHEIPDFIRTIDKNRGFWVLSIVIKFLIGNRDVLYFFILAFIQAVCLSLVYRKYSDDYVFSILLFVLSGEYMGWMHNGIRQFLAATLAFAMTTLMLKKKYVHLVILLLLISLFHQTVLIMLPFLLLVCLRKPGKWQILAIIGGTVLSVVFLSQFTGMLRDVLYYTQYSKAIYYYQMEYSQGTNFLRFLVYSVPVAIAFWGRKKIMESGDRVVYLAVNMSVVSACLYFLSMFTSGILFGRLPIYFSLYNYILLPWEIDNLFKPELRETVFICAVILYLIYYYVQMHVTWGI